MKEHVTKENDGSLTVTLESFVVKERTIEFWLKLGVKGFTFIKCTFDAFAMESIQGSRLERLCFIKCGLDERDIRLICSASTLVQLIVMNNPITGESAYQAISDMLTRSVCLTSLKLDNVRMGNKEFRSLLHGIRNSRSLVVLLLPGNTFSTGIGQEIFRGPVYPLKMEFAKIGNLESLSLEFMCLKSPKVKTLTQLLRIKDKFKVDILMHLKHFL